MIYGWRRVMFGAWVYGQRSKERPVSGEDALECEYAGEWKRHPWMIRKSKERIANRDRSGCLSELKRRAIALRYVMCSPVATGPVQTMRSEGGPRPSVPDAPYQSSQTMRRARALHVRTLFSLSALRALLLFPMSRVKGMQRSADTTGVLSLIMMRRASA